MMFVRSMVLIFVLVGSSSVWAKKETINYQFNGIAKLSNCSAFLVQFTGQSTNSNAYVLSNGHCVKVKKMAPGEAIENMAVVRDVHIDDGTSNHISLRTKTLAYATITGTDFSLYEIEESYLKLEETYKIKPFSVARSAPVVGTAFSIISGYWGDAYWCSVDGIAHEIHDGPYIFSKSIRMNPMCYVNGRGGVSGSPMIRRGSREVLGIVNTAATFEIDVNGDRVEFPNSNPFFYGAHIYGQNLFPLYECLNDEFKVDTSLEDCELIPGNL